MCTSEEIGKLFKEYIFASIRVAFAIFVLVIIYNAQSQDTEAPFESMSNDTKSPEIKEINDPSFCMNMKKLAANEVISKEEKDIIVIGTVATVIHHIVMFVLEMVDKENLLAYKMDSLILLHGYYFGCHLGNMNISAIVSVYTIIVGCVTVLWFRKIKPALMPEKKAAVRQPV